MAKIMFLLALGVIIGAGGAVDEIWWMKSMNTWSTIESGFETISDPTSSRYDQYNANCNTRDAAIRALNDSRNSAVSNVTSPAKAFFELAMMDIINGSEYSEAALFCGGDFACIRENSATAHAYKVNFTTNIIQFGLLYMEAMGYEIALPDPVEGQPPDRPTNSSAAA